MHGTKDEAVEYEAGPTEQSFEHELSQGGYPAAQDMEATTFAEAATSSSGQGLTYHHSSGGQAPERGDFDLGEQDTTTLPIRGSATHSFGTGDIIQSSYSGTTAHASFSQETHVFTETSEEFHEPGKRSGSKKKGHSHHRRSGR
ncbi:hypothetical protein SUNI508_13967 [Seiridium unicorne]|uniref:Dehydrin n=1 Tax=Seiridium unicorne TaxID=138068 RepID=A0ABR2VAM3_9PEZI